MHCPGGPVESVSLLGGFRHRIPQLRIFRLPQYFMRGLPFHRPFHHKITSSTHPFLPALNHQSPNPPAMSHAFQTTQPILLSPLPPTPAPHLPPAARSVPTLIQEDAQDNAADTCISVIFVAVLTPAWFAQFKKLQIKMINSFYRLLLMFLICCLNCFITLTLHSLNIYCRVSHMALIPVLKIYPLKTSSAPISNLL